jgi:putative membrane protein
MSGNQTFGRERASTAGGAPSDRNTATELTKERNRLAADRTLMAWIRTSLSLIAFGFGIGKASDYLRSAGIRDTVDPIRSTQIFGSCFVGLGMLALVAAIIQHTRILRRLDAPDYAYNAMQPITVTVAIALLMIGAFGLFGILL